MFHIDFGLAFKKLCDLDHVTHCQHPGSNMEKTKLGPLLKTLKLIIHMLNDLAHFRNTVVNDGTCENRPQIKFYVTT